jgi:hypothetical protein
MVEMPGQETELHALYSGIAFSRKGIADEFPGTAK